MKACIDNGEKNATLKPTPLELLQGEPPVNPENKFLRQEKFARIREVSAMLLSAPLPVRQAWRECADVQLFPKGYDTFDSCGRCFTCYPPGWYGASSDGKWRFICPPKGERKREIEYGTTLD